MISLCFKDQLLRPMTSPFQVAAGKSWTILTSFFPSIGGPCTSRRVIHSCHPDQLSSVKYSIGTWGFFVSLDIWSSRCSCLMSALFNSFGWIERHRHGWRTRHRWTGSNFLAANPHMSLYVCVCVCVCASAVTQSCDWLIGWTSGKVWSDPPCVMNAIDQVKFRTERSFPFYTLRIFFARHHHRLRELKWCNKRLY